MFTCAARRAGPAPGRLNDYRRKLLAASLLVLASAGKEPPLWQAPGCDTVATDEH